MRWFPFYTHVFSWPCPVEGKICNCVVCQTCPSPIFTFCTTFKSSMCVGERASISLIRKYVDWRTHFAFKQKGSVPSWEGKCLFWSTTLGCRSGLDDRLCVESAQLEVGDVQDVSSIVIWQFYANYGILLCLFTRQWAGGDGCVYGWLWMNTPMLLFFESNWTTHIVLCWLCGRTDNPKPSELLQTIWDRVMNV